MALRYVLSLLKRLKKKSESSQSVAMHLKVLECYPQMKPWVDGSNLIHNPKSAFNFSPHLLTNEVHIVEGNILLEEPQMIC